MPTTNDNGFSMQSTPTIAQPATPANIHRAQLNREYMLSLIGILRVLIIVIFILILLKF